MLLYQSGLSVRNYFSSVESGSTVSGTSFYPLILFLSLTQRHLLHPISALQLLSNLPNHWGLSGSYPQYSCRFLLPGKYRVEPDNYRPEEWILWRSRNHRMEPDSEFRKSVLTFFVIVHSEFDQREMVFAFSCHLTVCSFFATILNSDFALAISFFKRNKISLQWNVASVIRSLSVAPEFKTFCGIADSLIIVV